jgi:carbon-monoxide dehydrogenase small subunit
MTVNGVAQSLDVAPTETLLDVLRDRLGLTGTKLACAEGECGACTVIVDGAVLDSCLMPALAVDGSSVTSVEGIGDEALAPIQQAFIDTAGVQCGFCTPGFVVTLHALLAENPDPTDDEIRHAISGNLCRCTGYSQIVEAARAAAAGGGAS